MPDREEILELATKISSLDGSVRQFMATSESNSKEQFARLNELQSKGCALGHEHGRRLDALESKLWKAVAGLVMGMVAIILAAAGFKDTGWFTKP